MNCFTSEIFSLCIKEEDLQIPLNVLEYRFITKPLLIGEKAMEYYGLRKAGADIDFVIPEEDYSGLLNSYPEHGREIWGDLGVCVEPFEIWKSICLFDYAFLSEGAVELTQFKVVSLEKLLFMRALAVKHEKYHQDLLLIVDHICRLQYKHF